MPLLNLSLIKRKLGTREKKPLIQYVYLEPNTGNTGKQGKQNKEYYLKICLFLLLSNLFFRGRQMSML
jgi:hypothetical protein